MTALTTRDALPKGCDLIAAERKRQIEVEGWTPEHDAKHGSSWLLRAAEAYEWSQRDRWPWGAESWKPKDALSNLVRAGALYQAAVDVTPNFAGAAQAGVTRCSEKIDALLRASLDTLLASGAVIDAATLADDEAGVDHLSTAVEAVLIADGRRTEPIPIELADALNVLRRCRYGARTPSLAAALTERA